MLSRLFIFTFNLVAALVALALLALPLIFAENVLVPKFSARDRQLATMRSSFALQQPRPVVLLGDSTINALHSLPEDLERDENALNLGAGGSVISEWYFILRNYFRQKRDVKVLVLGMAYATRLETSRLVNPYTPFFMDAKDIWTFYRQGYLSLPGSLKLARNRALAVTHTSDDIVYSLALRAYRGMGPLVKADSDRQSQRFAQTWDRQNLSAAIHSRYFLEKILELARSQGVEVVFIKSPIHSEARKRVAEWDDDSLFRQFCGEYRVRCKDFSSALNDQFFHEDKVHLKHEHLYRYRIMIYHYLIEEGLLPEGVNDNSELEKT